MDRIIVSSCVVLRLAAWKEIWLKVPLLLAVRKVALRAMAAESFAS